jgi:hypothetical protein
MRKLLSASIITLAVAVSACTGFQHSESIISPTAPSLPNAPSGTSGALTGTWSSQSALTIPNAFSCGNFQWSISDQTASSLAGQFYAICAGVILVAGNASGSLNGAGTEVALHVSGTATVQSVLSCPFDLTGTGYIASDKQSIRIPYAGTTCLGPVHGEETLRRPAPNEPPPPPPAPPEPEPPAPAPAPSENPFHVAPGPLTVEHAHDVVLAVSREFPYLTGVPATDEQGTGWSEEYALRSIWHLKRAGFDAGRQRNPSGAISNDKLTILINGQWRAFDIASIGFAGRPMQPIFLEVGSPNPIAYPGLPD